MIDPLVKVAVGQLRIHEGDVDTNARRCAGSRSTTPPAAGADVLVLPECALTGYQFATRDESAFGGIDHRRRSPAAGAPTTRPRKVADDGGRRVPRTGGRHVANTPQCSLPDGMATPVRKTHLPVLGADRFVMPGDRIGPVMATSFGRLGVAICYDFRFPEVAARWR